MALDRFHERIERDDGSLLLHELRRRVQNALGSHAISATEGVYNSVRLYRFLNIKQMDVRDALTAIVLNSHARAEFKMDAKR